MKRNLTLLTDFYQLTMMNGYFKKGIGEREAVFDMFFRPKGQINYAVAAGLQQVVEYIQDINFTPDDIGYLRSLNTFDEEFLQYLTTFKFTGDLYAVLQEKPEAHRLANAISVFVTGSASNFNRQTNVDLNNPYTVIDISDLTGDMLVVGTFIAFTFTFAKVKEDITKAKLLVVDEAWQIIGASSNSLAANYIFEAVKTIRGYGGAPLIATQDISDFFALEDGKYGRGILNNCKIKIILNLEEDEAQLVQKVLKLTDAEIDLITRFERGNALISTNSNHVTVAIRCSQMEQELITTDREELRLIVERELKKKSNQEEASL